MEKKNNRLTNIIKDLASNEEKKVLTAIKQLRKHGKREALIPLIEVLASSANEDIKTQILSLLIDLKDQSVVEDLILAIENDQFAELRPTLISILWQSNLNASEYLSSLINQAIHGDYMTAVEVMTVVDSFDDTFHEADVEELKFDLDDAIAGAEAEKAKLLQGLRMSLDQLPLEF